MSPVPARDPWTEGEAGGSQLDDYDWTITSSRFGFTSYNQGKTPLLILEGPAVQADGEIVDDHHLWFSIGATMEPSEDGLTCRHVEQHKKAEPVFYNGQSAVMDFMRGALEVGAPVVDRDCGAEKMADGRNDPRDARVWVGLKFHMELKKTGEFTPAGAEKPQDVIRALPTKYLGVDGQAAAQTAAAPAQASASAAPASTPAPATTNGGTSAGMLIVIVKKVKAAGGGYWKFLSDAVDAGFDPNAPEVQETGVWANA